VAATRRTLCVDIGGTGIKTIVLDAAGKPVTERLRVETPRPATPRAVLVAVVALAKRQGAFDRASVGFPGVVRRGVTETAPNLHPSWVGFDLDSALTKGVGRNVRACNDADMQGLGVVRGNGVELVITLGTGFGSSLFVDGRLVPNVQLGHHAAWRDRTYEEELGLKALEKAGAKKWNRRLRKAIGTLAQLFNYDRLYIGGGNAKKITIDLPVRVRAVSNMAGLLGGIALWKGKEHDYGVR
jgi:polyphosphate glucokinase